MSVYEISDIFSLGNAVSVVGLMLFIIIWGEKRWRGAETKHDNEMKELRTEYTQIMQALKVDHQNALHAQREAHREEKNVFFSDLNKNLSELVAQLKANFQVNNDLAGLMNTIRAEQIEHRRDIRAIKESILVSNEILTHNSKTLDALIKCDMGDKNLPKKS